MCATSSAAIPSMIIPLSYHYITIIIPLYYHSQWYLYGIYMVFIWYLHRNYSEGTTGLFPTFRLGKRKKKLRAISDTQPENVLVIKSRYFL